MAFSGSLNAPLKPLYLLHGEEDLLRIEALDALRAATREPGSLNRERDRSGGRDGLGSDQHRPQADVADRRPFGSHRCSPPFPGDVPGRPPRFREVSFPGGKTIPPDLPLPPVDGSAWTSRTNLVAGHPGCGPRTTTEPTPKPLTSARDPHHPPKGAPPFVVQLLS